MIEWAIPGEAGLAGSSGSRTKVVYSEAERSLAPGKREAGDPAVQDLRLGTLAHGLRPATSADAHLLEILGRVPLPATWAPGRPRAALPLGHAPRPHKPGVHTGADLLRAPARLTEVAAAAAPGLPVTADPPAVAAADIVAVVAGLAAAGGEEDADESSFMLKPIW